MPLSDLAARRGDVLSILSLQPGADGLADLSHLDWAKAIVVLRGLTFRKVKLENTEVRPNLVECRIEDSLFAELSSCGHFWGAGNHWARCRFSKVSLKEAISPQCIFEDCRFENVAISNYRPCETVFSRCIFEGVSVFGMKATPPSGMASFNELGQAGSSVVFVACKLRGSTFENCYFDRVGFKGSEFSSIQVRNCDFTGIVSDSRWWEGGRVGDPFLAFLDDVLTLIRAQLGEQSAAVEVMREYRDLYASGRTTSRDYSACLFDGRVCYQDLRKIEDGLHQIETRYPL
jgi:uncharacterized protein YjbI with pentapeptide repeats